MGLFSFFKGQFIEVIEWLGGQDSMVYRFPAYDNSIKMGAKLVVRESQAAVFMNEGQLADVYGPGTYTLNTQNMPLLTALKSWKHGFNSPFKADVFFVSTASFPNLKWGTTNPVIMRDAEFGMIRLRGFGSYSIRVNDPALFLREIIGTSSSFAPEQIAGYLKSIIVTGVSDRIGESNIPVADLASAYEELSRDISKLLEPKFNAMGLSLTGLQIENLSLPEEVEKMIDRKSSMNIAGNLDQYMKFQASEALREAANNPESGAAGMGAGLGAGMAMGQMFAQAMNGGGAANSGQSSSAPTPPSAPKKSFCSECGQPLAENAKFCSGCGTKV
jgi:Putative virion core protein (lumpy skin disease virus)